MAALIEIVGHRSSVHWILDALNGRALPAPPQLDDPWTDVVKTSCRHGLAPLLWKKLSRRSDAADLPSHFLKELQRSYLANAAANIRHIDELEMLIGALNAAGIPAIVLKGVCLAKVVYGNIALRITGDIDIMVPPEEIRRSASLFESIGYTSEFEFEVEPLMDHRVHHIPRMVKAGKPPVELHWTVYPLTGLPFTRSHLDQVWTRSFSIDLGGVPAQSLCPEDMLLYLCLHTSAQHLFAFKSLRACFDIAELITRFQDVLDWNLIRDTASVWGMRPVRLMLMLARDLASASVPSGVLHELGTGPIPGEAIEQALTMMFGLEDTDVSILTSENLVDLGNCSLLEGSKLMLRRVFPSRGEMAYFYAVPADSWRIYFHYPVRWHDLLLRHTRHLFRLSSPDKQLRDRLRKQQVLVRWLRVRT